MAIQILLRVKTKYFELVKKSAIENQERGTNFSSNSVTVSYTY